MSTKLTYTGAEVQELLDKIEKGDFDNAKTLEGHPASYFAIASEFTSLAESFAAEQGRISALYSYFNNGSANDALRLGGQLPSYYATATQYEILQRTLSNFKSLFDSMFEKDSDGNIHAKLALWSSGGITAGDVGNGGSGGGGGVSYSRLDSWADYSADKAGYVLSAALGKDLDNRVSVLANAGYITQSALAPYALRSEIPSLVGYATQGWVGENYLSKSGGQIIGEGDYAYVQLRLSGDIATIGFQQYGVDKGVVGWLGNTGIRLQNLNGYGLAVRDSNEPIYYWGENGSVQRILLHSGNYTDYALSVNGGTVNGSITAPTFIGNLTGTADNANSLGGEGYRSFARYTDGNGRIGFYIPNTSIQYLGQGDGFIEYYDSGWYNAKWGKVTAVNGFIGNLTGNAVSATKLATPRTIWGQSFDGTGNITGDIMFAMPYKIAWHNDKENYYISSPTTSTSAYLEYNAYGGHSFLGGNVSIGGGPADERLHVYGNGKFTGALTTPVINTNTLKVGNITLVEENGALKVIGGLIATGGVTSGEKAS